MRCYLKTVIQALAVLLILSSLYSIIRRPLYTEQMSGSRVRSTTGHEDSGWIRNYSFDQSIHKTNRCVIASVRVLAGEIPPQKKYLTVGLSSVKRTKENYLLQTLLSIFNKSTEEELADIVVVVLLADFDLSWVKQTLKSILDQFQKRVMQNQLLVIHADQEHYPPLTGLKRNFNDASDRVTFRSKQNMDYAFLMDFSAGLSEYYLMLEDDVTCSKRFVSSIRGHIRSMRSSPWVTLEFSKLGYIGKLYHSEDLRRLAQFLFLFYEEMPCDFLLSHFRTLLMQNKVIRFRPSLFQHMGMYSSFHGTYNRLKDDDFQENTADNPAADVYTNIKVHEKHNPEEAYNQGTSYFWGKSPVDRGKYFLVVFREPVVLSRVRIQTGLNEKDILNSADVEIGETFEKTGLDCTGSHILGFLDKGQFDLLNVQEKVKNPVSCLRIRVTAAQSSWVIISTIQVWTNQ